MTRPGCTTGYRPMPKDFAETFTRVGWDGIEYETRGHKTTIRRWIEAYDAVAIAEGRPVLNVLRREWLERKYEGTGKRVFGRKPGASRAARYVLGRTLRPKWPCREPKFWDFGLIPAAHASSPARPLARRMTAEQAARIVETADSAGASPEFLAGMAKAAAMIRAFAREMV